MIVYKVFFRHDKHQIWEKGDLVLISENEPREDLDDVKDFVWVPVEVKDLEAKRKLIDRVTPTSTDKGEMKIKEQLRNINDVPKRHGLVQTPSIKKFLVRRKRAKKWQLER